MTSVSSIPTPSFNIALVGDAGVGKTEWLRGLANGPFNPIYYPTRGIRRTPLLFHVESTPISFEDATEFDDEPVPKTPVVVNFYEFAGQENFAFNDYHRAMNGDTVEAIHGHIVMYSTTSILSARHLMNHIEKCSDSTPLAIVGTKSRSSEAHSMRDETVVVRQWCTENRTGSDKAPILSVVDTKMKQSLDRPIINIVRKLMERGDLHFVPSVSVA